jgi:quercetin 2,3-dioxygenase
MIAMNTREVKKIVTGSHQTDGAGVKLVRVIGHEDVADFDPFLMLDAFDSADPEDYVKGFPWHPHRGIETVTYLIAGLIEHGDSLGNQGAINDGCCQWMTAGSGIIHQEMLRPALLMRGLQLWLNLPKSDKMTTPQYRDIRAEDIPKVKRNGATVGVIAGNYEGIAGAAQGLHVPARMLDVALAARQAWALPTAPEDTVFLYAVEGAGTFGTGGTAVSARQAALFSAGDTLEAAAGEDGIRFILFTGRPLREPVAWGGPIVMNTVEELRLAFDELHRGTFIK